MSEKTKTILLVLAGLVGLIALGAGAYMAYDVARNFLKKEEGEKLKKYLDIAGHWTVGIGHKILPGEKLDTITSAQSAAIFEADITRIDKTVSKAITRPMNAKQKAAVLSLAFNVGAESIATSTLLKKWNAGDTMGAADQFLVWKKITVNGAKVDSPALLARRQRERALFLS